MVALVGALGKNSCHLGEARAQAPLLGILVFPTNSSVPLASLRQGPFLCVALAALKLTEFTFRILGSKVCTTTQLYSKPASNRI